MKKRIAEKILPRLDDPGGQRQTEREEKRAINNERTKEWKKRGGKGLVRRLEVYPAKRLKG